MKKFVSLILSLALCISLVPTVFAVETVSADNKFTDVPASAWYLDDLNYALANGYISGTGDNTFSPDGNITRGQFVTILGRILGVSTASGVTKFTDVAETSYYAPYVSWAANQGYVNGTSDTTFAPDDLITFEQMGTILANYISKAGVTLTGYTSSEAYKDASSISQWAAANMEVIRQYGLIPTDASGNVRPQTPVNRAEGTVSLVRLAKATELGEEPTITQPPASQPQTPTQQTNISDVKALFARFISGNPQLITSHAADDLSAIESNIKYMLKNGVDEIRVSITPAEGNGSSGSDFDMFLDFFEELASTIPGSDSVIRGVNYSKAFYEYLGLVHDISVVPVEGSNDVYIRLNYDMRGNAKTLQSYIDSLSVAVSVHDELWASGALKSTMTQKEKARVYYDWLISHCDYDYDLYKIRGSSLDLSDTSDTSFVYGAFVNGKALCSGYTFAYNLFLRMEGIDCGIAESYANDHMWSTATLDGVLYHIDVTWGDTTGSPNTYFCMTEDAAWARFGGKPTGDVWGYWGMW